MTARPGAIDRLRIYFERLSSHRRLDLLKQVAAAGERGRGSAELAIVLEALRPGLEEDLRAESGLQFARLLFFRPCESFVVDERGSGKHRGFIQRASLDGVWKWLTCRAEWSNWDERTDRAVTAFLSGDLVEADAAVTGMRADAAAAIHEEMELASRSELHRQKLTLRVGGAQAMGDLFDIAEIFEREVDLEALAREVGASLGAAPAPLERTAIIELVDLLVSHKDPLDLPLIRIYREFADPTDVLRLLLELEGTDDGARLANSRLAGCVELLLADLDFAAARIDRCIGDSRRFDAMVADLRRFHRIARQLGVEIDLDRAPTWRATLGERRRIVSASLSGEIEKAADTIVRALRPPRTERDVALSRELIDRAVYLARLLSAVRPLRSELAVNGAVMQALRKIEAFLETLHTVVRADPRPVSQMPAAERERRQAFTTVCTVLAGPDGEENDEDEEHQPHARAAEAV